MNKFLLFILFSSISLFQLPAQSILLVNDNDNDPTRVDAIKTTLENLDYPYGFYNTIEEQAAPTAAYMEPFDLVIWYSGNDGHDLYFWNATETDNEELKTYIDNGGMLWLQGMDFLFDRYGAAPVSFTMGDFVYDYLGISEYVGQSHVDDGDFSDGLEYAEVVEDNGIFTVEELRWVYETLWYADALVPVDEAMALYNMAPLAYDLGGLATALLNETDESRVMSFAVETGLFDTQERSDSLFAQGLRYFKQFVSNNIPVESISISSTSGLDYIDEKEGSLTFTAEVLPENATNKFVEWSIASGGAFASIDENGVLNASGVSAGNGMLTVVARAIDGSGVTGSMDVTISGQGSAEDYEIVLVNDNAIDKTRYKVLENALLNNGYSYVVFNTLNQVDIPDEHFLTAFDVVIWYTGNDGLDLHLWDISDETDYAFNAPLKAYLDQGGILWLQGLDFLYDVFDLAPYPSGDDVFEPGSFIYDYLGIKKYVAQSYTDDGVEGVALLDVVPGNSICSMDPVFWSFPTMWYVDALEIANEAEGIYKLGPEAYQFSDYYAGVFNRMESTKSKVLTFTFEMGRLDSQESTDQLFEEVLESFRDYLSDEETVQLKDPSISIYPNPTSGNVTLQMDLKKSTSVGIEIYDLYGRKVFSRPIAFLSESTETLDLSELTEGMYIVTIINERNELVYAERLIKRSDRK